MTQLERLAQNIIFGGDGEKMQKVIETIVNGGVVAVQTIVRWKEDGEICQRDIAISKHESTEDFWFDEDFLFNVKDVPQFLFLLANLDFTQDEFDTEEEWLEELHKYEGDDKDDYFNSNEDFDVIDVIGTYYIEPDQFGEPIIGKSEIIEGGVKYTPGRTDNGYVFKDLNEIKNKTNNVCYIAEGGFDDETLIITEDNLQTEIGMGAVCTYQSALSDAKTLLAWHFPKFAECHKDLFERFAEHITDFVLQEVDWQCFSTMLNEIDIHEELDYFLQNNFVAFAKKRIVQDNDDTDISDDKAFRKSLLGFFGEQCYRTDDYTLTDWDSLIDEWENEPNY